MKTLIASVLVLALCVPGFAQSDTPYTADALNKVFTEMGYDASVNNNVVAVKTPVKDGTLKMGVVVDGDSLNMMFILTKKLKDPAAVPAKIFRSLLEENYKITPALFATYDGGLVLFRAVSNRQKDPARWKEILEDMAGIVNRTQPLWDSPEITAQWNASPAPGPSPAK